MAERITQSTIESNAWLNIFDTIDNRSNITDPRDSSGSKIRQFIYDSDPFEKGLDFSGMPYIVLELPVVENLTASVDGKERFVLWRYRIVVRTIRGGSSGTRIDAGRTDMFNICNDLQETFNSQSVRGGLRPNNVHNLILTKVDASTDIINQRDIYSAEYELTHTSRHTVSS